MMNSRTELMYHQEIAVNKLLHVKVGALFMEMGTGKSRTVIEIALLRQDKVSMIIWFCPVSLKPTVKHEILKHTDCLDSDIHVFDAKTSSKNCPDCFWYIVGIESMSSSARVVSTINKLIDGDTMVIVDESSFIKGHNSLRTQRITYLSQNAKYRIILTGTPLSQGVVDLYAQMKFLSPNILGYSSFYSFSANHLEYHPRFRGMIVQSHNTDFLAAKIQPYVYQVTKDECLTLPDKIYKNYYFNLLPDQEIAYDNIKNKLLNDLSSSNNEISRCAILKLFTRLQQIVCGFQYVKDEYGEKKKVIEFEHERLSVLNEAISDIPANEKIIIWCKYQHDIHMIVECLSDNFGSESVAEFHGMLSSAQKEMNIKMFRNKARFFIATPSCGGHGLTLNESCYVIFYNNSFKYADRIQAEDRNHRIGQDNKVIYIDIICEQSIDTRIMSSLQNKCDVVRDFKISVDKVKNDKIQIEKLVDEL